MRVVFSAFLAVVAATAAVSCHAESTAASPPSGLLSLPFLSGGSTATTASSSTSGPGGGGGGGSGGGGGGSNSLEISIPLSQSSSLSKNDAPLMRDIEMLNDILNNIIQKEDMNTYQLVEQFLEYGRER